MQKIRWFFLIAVVVLVLVVVLQNNHTANVHLLLYERSVPLSVLLLFTTATGFLLGALMTAIMLRNRGRAVAEKKAKKAASEPALAEKPAPESADI